MHRQLIFIFVSALLLHTSASADTLVRIKDGQGQKTHFMSNGEFGRMNIAGDDQYMIIHYASQSVKMVMPSQRQVLDMSGGIPSMGGKAPEKVDMQIKAISGSPKIAGYVTRAYQLSANGENCGTLYASKKAMNGSNMRKMFSALQNMAEKSRQRMGAFSGMLTQCQRAQMSMSNSLSKVGAPLRMKDSRGKIQSEVLSIDKNATLRAGTFTIPANYKVINMADQMRQGQAAQKKAQQGMPDMGKMMQEMQKSGGMTPEMMEQMKKMRKMFQ